MVFAAKDLPAVLLNEIRTHSTAPALVKEMEADQNFRVTFERSSTPPQEKLKDVRGWTYLGLYADKSDTPLAMIIDSLAPEAIPEWVEKVASVEVMVWFNPNLHTSDGDLVATALHEFELHVIAFRTLFNKLKEAHSLRSENESQGATAIKDLQSSVNRYRAVDQHASAELRANQVVAALSLTCHYVAAKNKETTTDKPEIDTESYEYKVLMSTRNDVTGGDPIPPTLQDAYRRNLAQLSKTYGENVAVAVVEEFELD